MGFEGGGAKKIGGYIIDIVVLIVIFSLIMLVIALA